MKTNFKSALIACAILSAGLIGCSKENTGSEETTGDKSVRIRLIEPASASRAVGTHVGAEPIVMSSAYVYFTNAANDIVKYVAIDFTAGGTNDTDPSDGNVGYTTATTTGFTMENLPGTIATGKVFIVGNLPSAITYPTSGNMSQLDAATIISVASQYDATNKRVAAVSMIGSNTLTADASTPTIDNDYTSEVDVYPITARMEVGKVIAEKSSSTATSWIGSYLLQGIYINNYFPTMGLNGSAAGTIVNNGSTNASYSSTGTSYTTDGILSDYSVAGFVLQGTSSVEYASVATATEDNVWGYNVLAPETSVTGTLITAGTDVVPHIVVHIDNVVLTDANAATTDDATTYTGDRYLTVRNIYVDGSTTRLTALQKGYVYRIKELRFNESNLTTNPELASIDVTVTAELMTWVPKDVTYDFD